jgi:GDPmannose 4,6-dehydratase
MLEELLAMSTARNIRIDVDPAHLRPIDADLQVPDTRKFHDHTGWEPINPFETTMWDLLEYWRGRLQNVGNAVVR